MRENEKRIFVSGLASWAPGISGETEWNEFANGKREILQTNEAPKILYTDMLFRRRLSALSKMTVEAVHGVIEKNAQAKNFREIFVSFRGELSREFSVSMMLIKEKMILPTPFSLSVFNAPIALAAIALNLREGYTTIFPSKENFCDAWQAASASVIAENDSALFVYADEYVRDDYRSLTNKNGCEQFFPLAFAFVMRCEKQNETDICIDAKNVPKSASGFLKMILKNTNG